VPVVVGVVAVEEEGEENEWRNSAYEWRSSASLIFVGRVVAPSAGTAKGGRFQMVALRFGCVGSGASLWSSQAVAKAAKAVKASEEAAEGRCSVLSLR